MVFQEVLPHIGAHAGFFSGLTMLIPILGTAWEQNLKPWLLSPTGFFIALALILVSVIVLAWLVGSISKLLKNIGWMMIIPGVLALVFAATSQDSVYSWAEQRMTGFSTVEPVVHWFVEHSVPKAAYLGGFYILFGVCLVWFGRKLERAADYV